MNFKKSLLFAALPVLFLTACKQSESAPASTENTANVTASVAATRGNSESSVAKPETASFKIDGMVCAVGCAKTIENKLAKLDGVTKATVDYDKKEATVEFDAAKQSPEKLVEVVEKTGDGKTYKVSDVKSSGNHAMMYNGDPVKEKDKKKKSKKGKEAAKKEGCEKEGKSSCCAKKSAHSA